MGGNNPALAQTVAKEHPGNISLVPNVQKSMSMCFWFTAHSIVDLVEVSLHYIHIEKIKLKNSHSAGNAYHYFLHHSLFFIMHGHSIITVATTQHRYHCTSITFNVYQVVNFTITSSFTHSLSYCHLNSLRSQCTRLEERITQCSNFIAYFLTSRGSRIRE